MQQSFHINPFDEMRWKKSLAQWVVMVFEAKDTADLKRVLHQAGFSDEEIKKMMSKNGRITALPVGAFTDSLNYPDSNIRN